LHHDLELIKGHFAVSILIDFENDLPPHIITYMLSHSENATNFVDGNGSTIIFIIVRKSLLQLIILQKVSPVSSCGHELGKVNLIAVIHIHQFKNPIYFILGHVLAVVIFVASEQFFVLELAVLVCV
jgi:glucose uptake protein GlcU